MQFPQIRMESQFARIGIDTTLAKLHIEQPKADLQIEQPPAKMEIRTTPGWLTIDQTKAWEDMNIKSVFRRTEEHVARTKEKLQEGIARVVSEGDEMLDIHTGQNAIIEQAVRQNNPPPPEVNITWIPSPFSVKIDYEPAKLEINIEPQKPKIHAQMRKPIFSYQPGNVNIYLQQQNELKIDVVK